MKQNIPEGQMAQIFTDSKLVHHQILGLFKVKKQHLKHYHNDCKAKYERVKHQIDSFQWIPRNENIAGIQLELIQSQRKRV